MASPVLSPMLSKLGASASELQKPNGTLLSREFRKCHFQTSNLAAQGRA